MKTIYLILIITLLAGNVKSQTVNQIEIEQKVNSLLDRLQKTHPRESEGSEEKWSWYEKITTSPSMYSHFRIPSNYIEADSIEVYESEMNYKYISFLITKQYSRINFVDGTKVYRLEKYRNEIRLDYFEDGVIGKNFFGDDISGFIAKDYYLPDLYQGFEENIAYWDNLLLQQESDSIFLYVSLLGMYYRSDSRDFETIPFEVKIMDKNSLSVIYSQIINCETNKYGIFEVLNVIRLAFDKKLSRNLIFVASYDLNKKNGGSIQKEMVITEKITKVFLDVPNSRMDDLQNSGE